MPLIAHYPLIENARDYTLNRNHGTARGVQFVKGGKIGGYASFNLDGDAIIIPHTELLSRKVFGKGNAASISIWVYPKDLSSGTCAVINKATGPYYSNITFGIVQFIGGYRLSLGSNREGNATGSQMGIEVKPPLNTWNHLVGVIDDRYLRFYMNGQFVGEKPLSNVVLDRSENESHITMGPMTSTYSTSKLRSNVSDLRIYDHALSIKEISELYKAKVAHYRFSDFQEPTTNVVTIDNDIRYLKINDSYIIDDTLQVTKLERNRYKIEFLQDSQSNIAYTLGRLGQMTETSYQHTLSVDIVDYYINDNGGDFGVTRYKTGNLYSSNDLLNGQDRFFRKHIVLDVDPSKLGVDYTDDLVVGAEEGQMVKAGSYLILENIQSERTGYATPYVETARAANIVDSSGFNRDITVQPSTGGSNSFPRWVEESPTGTGSYHFRQEKPLVIPYGEGIDLTVQPHTISMWVKPLQDFNPGQVIGSVIGDNQRFYMGNNYGVWSLGIHDKMWSITSSPVILNKWTHLSLVTNGTHAILYVDGKEVERKSYGSFKLASNIYIGGNNAVTSVNDALISDVRIYASSFSEEEVQELYKQRGSLDEKGDLLVSKLNYSPILTHYFTTDPFSQQGVRMNFMKKGIINLTTDSDVSYMAIAGVRSMQLYEDLMSVEQNKHYIFEVKYRVVEGVNVKASVAFTNGRQTEFSTGSDQRSEDVQMIADGEWHTLQIDLSLIPGWDHSPLKQLRFYHGGAPDQTIEYEYIKIRTDKVVNSFDETGVITAQEFISSSIVDGMVLWWPLDGKLYEVAHESDPTVRGSGVRASAFLTTLSMETNSPTGYIHSATPDMNCTEGSIAFWLYIGNDQSWNSTFNILEAYTEDSEKWLSLYRSTSTTLRVGYGDEYVDIPDSVNLFKGKYVQVTIRYSDTNNDDILEVYLDGTLIASKKPGVDMSTKVAHEVFLMADKTSGYTKGKITDVRVFNRLLTPLEISVMPGRLTNSGAKMKLLDTGELYIKGTYKEVDM